MPFLLLFEPYLSPRPFGESLEYRGAVGARMSSMEEGRTNCTIAKVDGDNLHRFMDSIIAVRTSAYEQWNGPKSAEQRREEAADWIKRIRERRNSAVYLALEGEETIGYVWGYEKDAGSFHISHIGIRQDRKRRGIGRRLLRKCEDLSRGLGYRSLTTSTYRHFQAMLSLLEKEGYRVTGESERVGAGNREARIELVKDLR